MITRMGMEMEMDGDGGNDDEDKEDDEEDDSDIPEPTPQKKRGRHLWLLPSRSAERHDPDPPSAYEPDFPPDDLGWTWSLADVLIRPFRARKPTGPKFCRSNSPLKYFFNFFPLTVKWTNLKLREAGAKMTNIQEVHAWFGVNVLMGLIKQANYRNYWSTHPALRNNLISSTFSRNRIDTLNTHLTCNDPDKDPAHFHDKAYQYRYKKNRPLFPLQPGHQGRSDPAVHNLTRKIPDNATGRRVSSVIAAPPQVCDYTQFMGGMDSDQPTTPVPRKHNTGGTRSYISWWTSLVSTATLPKSNMTAMVRHLMTATVM